MIAAVSLARSKSLVKIVATGGLAPLIANVSEEIDEVDDQLTLEGLRIIYQRTRAA